MYYIYNRQLLTTQIQEIIIAMNVTKEIGTYTNRTEMMQLFSGSE